MSTTSRNVPLSQKRQYKSRGLLLIRLQRKVRPIQIVDLDIPDMLSIRLRPGGREDDVVLAPDGEHGYAGAGEVVVDLGVQGEVGAVVPEEVELDGVVARALEQGGVEVVCLGGHGVGAGGAVGVLEFGGGEVEHGFLDGLALGAVFGGAGG